MNPKSRSMKIAAGASVALVLILGAAVAASDDGGDKKPSAATSTPSQKPNAAPKAPADKADKTEGDSNPMPKIEKGSIEEFKLCIQQKGMVAEKTAGTHVTKLSGMDDWNGILDNPKIWTNYVGGFAKHAAEGNVLASVFADCYSSKNGLVTVYGQDGHVIGTGQF